MNLVFDNIVFDLQKSGGISILWYELLRRVCCQERFDINYIDNKSEKNHWRRKLSIEEDNIIRNDWWPRFQSYLPVSLNQREQFVYHSSYYRYCTHPQAINVTTVHDFTYEFFSKGFRRKLHSWQKFRAIRHSQYIVCISENTKRDLMKMLPDVNEERIRVIYNGVSDDYHVLPQKEESLPFPEGSYVVFVGGHTSYKNFELCLKALPCSDYNLLVIGHNLDKKEQMLVERYLPQNRYKYMGYVSNEKLNVLYNHAAALVYPSSYEGFGIPVIEAQRAGCPVIALNSSSIPEVIGETPLLMKELSENELVSKLKLLKEPSLMKQVRDHGLVNSQRFSWDKMYHQYEALYDEALSKKNM